MKFKLYTILLLIGFSLLAAPGDFVKDIKIEELEFKIPEVNKMDIHSKLKYYSIYSNKFPITYLEIAIYAGEADTGSKGIELPQLLAEVLKFGGSKNLPEEAFTGKLESLGASFSIASDYDKISINLSYLSRDEETVLNLLSDLIQNPNYSEIAFNNGKKKMTEMIQRRNERTESVGFRKAKELFYRGLLAGKTSQVSSIEKIKIEDVKEFWNLALANKKVRISITGLFDDRKIREKFAIVFPEQRPNKPQLVEREIVTEASLSKSLDSYKYKNLLISKDVNQSMVLMIGALPRHNDPDFYAMQILDYIIGGGGFNSYMMQQIRVDKGLAYSSTSYPVFKKEHGILYAYTLTKNQSLLQVHDLMKEILSEKTFLKITEKEIEDAKKSINNQFVFLFLNDNRILENQVKFDEDEMPTDYLKKYRDNMDKVTLLDIRRVGEKYFNFEKLKTIIVSSPDSLKNFPKENSKTILPEESIE
jgi:zinc protease